MLALESLFFVSPVFLNVLVENVQFGELAVTDDFAAVSERRQVAAESLRRVVEHIDNLGLFGSRLVQVLHGL